ncbi:DUF445 family protein [Desulfallas sp. Bu1-1]|uniref:DUF445 family protein n=1 Tax=Desulfallas sp. Bu1-1 TaxID=2787620 RepID=UPI00189F936F|nr:DUF445 family protein [Desulfallas sp. Bu1-1]MBF7083436.1 DUF445 family protein [Desulfallas sp. Bu1-1]
MNWQQVATAVIVGAVIGYITNWIAIRMLFRPLYEKRILGVPVPFTPGVIPRGKKRLAGGIGEMVGGMLLTEENVVQHLSSAESEERVRRYVTAWLAEARARELTVGEALVDAGVPPRALDDFAARLSEFAVNLARGEAFRGALAHSAAHVTGCLLERRVGSPVGETGLPEFREFLERLPGHLLNEEITGGLQRELAVKIEYFFNSPQKIGNYLPEAVREGIHQFINDQAPGIVSAIEQYLSSPGARQAIKNRIENFFEGTALKRMLNGVFQLIGSGPDMLTQRLAAEISRFLADERNRAAIVDRLHLLVDEALEKSVSEITAALDAAGKREKAAEIAAWLVEKLRDPGFGTAVLDVFESVLDQNRERTWQDLLHLDHPGFQAGLAAFYGQLLEKLLDRDEPALHLQSFVQREIGNAWNAKLGPVLDAVFTGAVVDPVGSVVKLYRFLVQNQVPGLMRFLNISDMVRRRVEELDVLQVEQMLLGIIRRELVAITWLGALLGAVLGLVMVGMQIMMK